MENSKAKPDPDRQPMVRSSQALSTRCPYCHDDCQAAGQVLVCRSCLARHHEGCWIEAGACANCAETIPLGPLSAPASAPASQEVVYDVERTELGVWRRHTDPRGRLFAEFTSHRHWGSLPLLHYVRGRSPETKRTPLAKGVVAVGRKAVGVVAIGQISLGVLAVGQASFGILLGLGQFATGLVAAGQLALGVLFGLGQLATGVFVPLAQLALGLFNGPCQVSVNTPLGAGLMAFVVSTLAVVVSTTLRRATGTRSSESSAGSAP